MTWLILPTVLLTKMAVNQAIMANEPCRKKTCLQGLRPVKTRTGMVSWWDWLGARNFSYSKYRYYTIQAANNIGADQTAQICRLISAFVVPIWHKQVFLMMWLKWYYYGVSTDLIWRSVSPVDSYFSMYGNWQTASTVQVGDFVLP